MQPIVVINFKAYREATGARAIELAQECETAAKQYGMDIRLAVQATDIFRVSRAVSLPVYAQHIDPVEPSRNTGWVSAHAVKEAGARGVLVSHSEHRLPESAIVRAVDLAHKEGLETIVFVEDTAEMRRLEGLTRPSFFCVEPAALVAGDVSVSMAKPDLVKEAVQATSVPVLVGAGVKTHEDLAIAMELRARGVLLASGVVLAKHRGQALRKLLSAHAR